MTLDACSSSSITQGSSLTSLDLGVLAAASLVTLEDGTLTAEMVLHAGDQHVYDAVRQPRSNLHLLWHHLTVRPSSLSPAPAPHTIAQCNIGASFAARGARVRLRELGYATNYPWSSPV
jgi:hypothetical protein